MKRFILNTVIPCLLFFCSITSSFVVQSQEVSSTWMWGSNRVEPTAVFGEKGVPSPSNSPGPKYGALSWTAPNGYLYLFGGNSFRISSGSESDYMNDLWQWDGANWTWISGTDQTNQRGVYGTKGVASPENMPGARSISISWVKSNGDVYVFGGQGYDAVGNRGLLNDLWKWDGKYWTWISGSNLTRQNGVAEEMGVANANNVPGARREAVSWLGSNEDLFLFSGGGFDLEDDAGWLNDLWKWDGENWTWLGGSRNINDIGSLGSRGVTRSSNMPAARLGAVSWVDNEGGVFVFGGFTRSQFGGADRSHDLWKWDGENWTWIHGPEGFTRGVYGEKGVTSALNLPEPRSHHAASYDPNTGITYVFGGVDDGRERLNDLWKWDGENWTWLAGEDQINQGGVYGTQEVPSEENIPGARRAPSYWTGLDGAFYIFGGSGYDFVRQGGDLNDLWRISEPKETQSITFNEVSEKEYGAADFQVNAVPSSGLDMFFTSSDESVATVSSNTVTIHKAGSTVITGSQPGNQTYYAAKSVTRVLMVKKTELVLTAEDKIRIYGEDNPTFTISYSGFVNGENLSFLDVAPMINTNATATSEVGIYDISISSGNDTNYELTLLSGGLTINKASLIARVDDAIREVNEENPDFTFSYTGFANGETMTVLDEKPNASTDAEISSEKGTYAIIAEGGNDNNYDFVLHNGDLTIIGPEVEFPTNITFEPTGKEESAVLSLSISNQGDGPLRVNEITMPSGFSVDKSSLVVNAQTSETLEVTFQPTEPRLFEGDMLIRSNDGDYVINLEGEGVLITGLEDSVLLDKLSIYPNPVSNKLNIDLSAVSGIDVSVSMVNSQGTTVLTKSVDRNKAFVELDVSTKTEGLYFILIKTANSMAVKKILIKR